MVRSATVPDRIGSRLPAALPDGPAAVAQPSALARFMGRWRWRARLWSERLGHLGRWGIGLAALGVTVYLSAVLPGRADLRHGQDRVAALHERLAQEAERTAQSPDPSGDELDRFYRFLPPDTDISDAFRTVYRISARNDLQLEQGEYRVAVEGLGRILRYEATFPIVGRYPQIRLFVRQVSAQLPFAVPDKIHFEYQDDKSGQVKATVRLLLYTRKAS